jgi:drug/metabolite transporter (DMT)-like permease
LTIPIQANQDLVELAKRDNLKLAIGAILVACFTLSLWLNIVFVGTGAVALLVLYLWQPGSELVAANPFLFGAWTPMWLDEWRIMAILATAIVVGSIGAAIAYQNGPSSIIATFDFAYVGFAAIWGFMLFAEVPGARVTIGIILIVIGGVTACWQKSG